MTWIFPNCFFLIKKSRVHRRSSIQTWLLLFTFLIARFMGPTWGPSGADKTQVGPMLVPWTLLFVWESSLLNSSWLTHPGIWFRGKHHYLLHITFISARCQGCVIATTSLKYHRDSKDLSHFSQHGSNFIPSMNKSLHPLQTVGWNNLSIPKCQWWNRWSLGKDKWVHHTLNRACWD